MASTGTSAVAGIKETDVSQALSVWKTQPSFLQVKYQEGGRIPGSSQKPICHSSELSVASAQAWEGATCKDDGSSGLGLDFLH